MCYFIWVSFFSQPRMCVSDQECVMSRSQWSLMDDNALTLEFFKHVSIFSSVMHNTVLENAPSYQRNFIKHLCFHKMYFIDLNNGELKLFRFILALH